MLSKSKRQLVKYFKNQKSDKKRLAAECLALWAECVKAKAKYQCEWCKRKENLNAHHFFSRSRQSVRYNIENGICLCSNCHSLSSYSAHKNPLFKDELLKRKIRTEQWLILLERQANTPQKLDLNLELLFLQNEAKKYKIAGK